jgi:hypothetical protein
MMDEDDNLPKYLSLIRQCARRQRIRLPIFVDDLIEFFSGDSVGLSVATGSFVFLVAFCWL